MGLFKTLIYAALIYYGWKFLRTLFVVKKHLNQRPPTNFNNEYDNSHNRKQDNNDKGEYVDYEELDK